jgi:hypothetical protein
MKSLLIGVCLLLVSCSAINEKVGLPDDNAIEQLVEVIIHYETGLSVDLTPAEDETSR